MSRASWRSKVTDRLYAIEYSLEEATETLARFEKSDADAIYGFINEMLVAKMRWCQQQPTYGNTESNVYGQYEAYLTLKNDLHGWRGHG